MKLRIIAAVLAPLCFAGAAQAAGSTQAQFNVKMNVTAGCTLTTAGDINFGDVVGTAAQPSNAATTITATCTNGTPYTITFAGSADSDTTTKVMKGQSGGNTDTLTYQLVNATTTSTVYGSDPVNGLSGTGNGSAQSTSVAAKLTNWSSKAVAPDVYSDVVTATITY